MTKRTRNFISFILTLCLLLSILPAASAAAASEQSTGSIAEATATVEEPTTTQDELPILQLDADCQILKHVDEEAFAAGKHIARLPEEETLSSYVFLNADGSKTAYFMDQPVKFTDADGSIKEKNLTLTAATEGYTTTQNDIQLTLPTDPTSGIRIVYNNRMITLIPQGGTLTASAQVADNSVTYPDYYGEGMSLRYTPTLSGVKEDILLDAYTGVNSFTFRLNTGGLNLYQANGRYFLAESKTGTDRIVLGDVVVYDANSKFSMGTLTSQTIMPGQAYLLTLTVDEAFLTDEATAYPVTIDPTLEVSDNTTAGSIEDATIYEGKPTLNTGTWQYNRAGYYDSSYGIGHIVVRLKGLLESNEYINTSDKNITSATFNIKDADSGAAGTLYLYPMHSNTTWTETGITWGNKGTYVGIAYDTVSVGSNQWASFDITDLLKDWKTGDRNPNAGFIIDASSQNTRLKSFYSSENTTTAYRPYVVMTYTSSLTLSQTAASVLEGDSLTLSVTSDVGNQTVSWDSSNQTAATVNNGVVTAVKAGLSVITATTPDGSSGKCVVNVAVADGVYRISYAGLTLGTAGGIGENTPACLVTRADAGLAQLQQLWMVKHLGSGYYSIRPLYQLDMGLRSTNGTVDITIIGTTDISGGVPDTSRWMIEYDTSGYVFQYRGNSSQSMRCSSPSPSSSIITDYYSSMKPTFKWTLEAESSVANQVLLLDKQNGANAANCTRYIVLGQTTSLSTLGIEASFVSTSSIDQSISWSSMNPSIVSVDSSTGSVTGLTYGGTATITATHYHHGLSYQKQYTIHVVNANDMVYKIVHYYDTGYNLREGGASAAIQGYHDAVATRLERIFGIKVFSSIKGYSSVCDKCKINQHGAVLSTNLDSLCRHPITCTTTDQLFNDLLSQTITGNDTTTVVSWTGHRMLDHEHDRSCSDNELHSVVITTYEVLDWSDTSEKTKDRVFSLLHELSHQFGASDHYCTKQAPDDTCTNPLCDICCYGYLQERECIMSRVYDISTLSDNALFCSDCRSLISSHIQDHHMVEN
jgi:uncharacterized protein YjdB